VTLPRRPALATVGLILLPLTLLGACANMPSPLQRVAPSGAASAGPPTAAAPVASAADVCSYEQTGDPARPVQPPPTAGVATTGTVKYVLKMNEGDVTITMDRAKAPCTVNSFVSLADQGYFDNTKCHRLVDSGIFLLQCGDPTGSGSGGPGYEFANETDAKESYTAGVVAMANGGPNTNGSQFFLVWADSTGLDSTPNYTIFGRMNKASTDVIASIAASGQDGSNPAGGGKPNNPAEIISAKPA
jgi:peptidyl-prolyl cis-trans isomerase B (cyclophilin B)